MLKCIQVLWRIWSCKAQGLYAAYWCRNGQNCWEHDMDWWFHTPNPAVSCTMFWGKFLSVFGHGPRKAINRPCEHAIVWIGPIWQSKQYINIYQQYIQPRTISVCVKATPTPICHKDKNILRKQLAGSLAFPSFMNSADGFWDWKQRDYWGLSH